MTLKPGTKLGRYEILGPLGAGGMGEVYRARDGRLQREVALKVLPAAIAHDAERLQRFEREARAASALNHPGILTVYDFCQEDDLSFLVTELLEGESLRERLGRGALPTREALEYAAQAAQALAAVHARESSIATSSPRTSSSPATATSRSSTSASRCSWRPSLRRTTPQTPPSSTPSPNPAR